MNGWVGFGSGIATSTLLLALAACGLHLVSVLIAAAILLCAATVVLLNAKLLSDLAADLRASLADCLNLTALATILALPTLFSCFFHPLTGTHLWPVRGLLISLAVCGASIYLSNFIDWAYTRPRLRGTRSVLPPCRASTQQRLRTVTQALLGQRILTYALVRLGLAAAVAFLAVATLGHIGSTATSLLAVAAGALAAYYLNRVIPMASLATDPPIQIGDVILLAEEYGSSYADWPSYYVSQIVFEGVHLTELGGDGKPRSNAPLHGHDRLIELADVKRLLRRRQTFVGCDTACSAANPFCPLHRGDPL